ncbi:MAG: hypothetical protein KKD35_03090 [Elusimicrobia bacterium]|nr:hypothetical protein [Elusimicrobiota bacterium]
MTLAESPLHAPKGVFDKIGNGFNKDKTMCDEKKLKRNKRLRVAEEVVG